MRENYKYWKKFEGKELALFTWEGKPYRSKQNVFCIKKLVSVQLITYRKTMGVPMFLIQSNEFDALETMDTELLAKNDGFNNEQEFIDWFANYPEGEMAILHFTDFRY
jgi:hypothetical protein